MQQCTNTNEHPAATLPIILYYHIRLFLLLHKDVKIILTLLVQVVLILANLSC